MDNNSKKANTNYKTSFFENQKKKKFLILLLALSGIIMIVFSYIQSNDSDNSNSQNNSDTCKLEERLERIIESATGDGTVKVMITLENVRETVYESSENDYDTSFFGTSYTETPDTPTAKYSHQSQKIKGVMIVCKGITQKSDFDTIKRAVSTALGIGENQIYIIGGLS